MGKYRSKQHTIQAFQFERDCIPPDWFLKAMNKGKAQFTIDKDDEKTNIVIYGDRHKEKAFLGDWICRASHGKIYVLDNTRFKESYCITP